MRTNVVYCDIERFRTTEQRKKVQKNINGLCDRASSYSLFVHQRIRKLKTKGQVKRKKKKKSLQKLVEKNEKEKGKARRYNVYEIVFK